MTGPSTTASAPTPGAPKWAVWLIVVVILGSLMGCCIITTIVTAKGVTGFFGTLNAWAAEMSKANTASTPATTVATVVVPTSTVPPFVPNGSELYLSWETWDNRADQEWAAGDHSLWLARAGVDGFPSVAVAQKAVHWQIEREHDGYNYLKALSTGIYDINTGRSTGGGYSRGLVWLPAGTIHLAWDPANPYLPREIGKAPGDDFATKGNCWNPGRWTTPKGKAPPRHSDREEEIPCPPRDSAPDGSRTPHDPGNETGIDPPDPGRTPGAAPPQVIEDILDEPEEPAPPATEERPDGTVVATPPPPNTPPAPPPPAPDPVAPIEEPPS